MRKLLIFLLLLTPSLSNAQPRYLHLYMNDGSHVAFPFEATSKIILEKGQIAFGNQIFNISGISKYTLGRAETEGIEETENAPLLKWEGEKVVVNAKGIRQVGLYGTDGKTLRNAVANENGEAVVDSKGLLAGVYVLKIGTNSIKIQKK